MTIGQGFLFYAFQPVKSILYAHIHHKPISNSNLKYCHFLSIFICFYASITPKLRQLTFKF
ncbi:hypothetical protein HMPREF9096_00927 [Haemophilus sp. oral taxon 851 str. F0397]|nr:hypothetical protein HMPREF9096_00927 [Haemophilus sp. oral taxon 851 str. F0397]